MQLFHPSIFFISDIVTQISIYPYIDYKYFSIYLRIIFSTRSKLYSCQMKDFLPKRAKESTISITDNVSRQAM